MLYPSISRIILVQVNLVNFSHLAIRNSFSLCILFQWKCYTNKCSVTEISFWKVVRSWIYMWNIVYLCISKLYNVNLNSSITSSFYKFCCNFFSKRPPNFKENLRILFPLHHKLLRNWEARQNARSLHAFAYSM